MTTYRFTVHKYPTKKRVPCVRCGRTVRRQRTFEGTSNPFSTPPYMDRQQMFGQLLPEIDAWLSAYEMCASCQRRIDDGDVGCA